MALQKDFLFTRDGFEGELIAKNAYFKVSTMPDMTGDNFIKQAYLQMKKLPRYADAMDV